MKIQWQKIEATRQRLAGEKPELEQESSEIAEQGQTGELPTPDAPESSSLSLSTPPARKTPVLPKLESHSVTKSVPSLGNGASPFLAMNLLKEMEMAVNSWQQELQQILRQIQDLYLEGPIIEGWLESETAQTPLKWEPEAESGGRAISRSLTSSSSQPEAGVAYRLVGKDRNGNLWFRPCPPEELPGVILAVARYQKLLHLLERKERLENRLAQLAEGLVVLQGRIQTL